MHITQAAAALQLADIAVVEVQTSCGRPGSHEGCTEAMCRYASRSNGIPWIVLQEGVGRTTLDIQAPLVCYTPLRLSSKAVISVLHDS